MPHSNLVPGKEEGRKEEGRFCLSSGVACQAQVFHHAPASAEEDLSIRHGWRGLQKGEAVPSVWRKDYFLQHASGVPCS